MFFVFVFVSGADVGDLLVFFCPYYTHDVCFIVIVIIILMSDVCNKSFINKKINK